ncbi:MAG: hypothetical protein ACYTGB_07070 [Planctomycetota bacterium]|jgi:DNA-directed RNA polymerase subunit RPC12/RpoP
MADEENPTTPPLPQEPVGDAEEAVGETAQVAPVAKAFICSRCRKGKLDPTGLKMGDWMACPDCGHRTKVTLEHTMGEERASRRQKTKKTFEEMDDEEKAEFLAKKTPVERFFFFVKYKLGPKGIVILYLSLIVVVAILIIGAKLASGEYELKTVKWWVVLLWIIGGAAVGIGAHFGYVSLMYYYKKNIAPKTAGGPRGSRRMSTRRRSSSVRKKRASEDDDA